MSYSINVGMYVRKYGMSLDDALKMVKNIGFEALDYTSLLKDADYAKNAEKELELIQKHGLYVEQTHGPYNRYNQWGDEFGVCLERAYEITKMFGAKYLVVHGDEFDFEKFDFSPKKAIEYNYEIYAPYVERAEKDGISIAFETVFQDLAPEKVRFCSKAEELKAMIEKFNSPAAVCCWDFGHAHISMGVSQADNIRLLGKYIKCTHVHDNRLGKDLHLPLFMGDTNLEEIRKAFRDIEYNGIFSLELGGAHKTGLVSEALECYTRYAYESLKIFDKI